QLRPVAKQQLLELVEIGGGDVPSDEPRAGVAKRLDRAEIPRPIDDDGVAAIDEAAREEIEPLLRAREDEDVLGIAAEAVRARLVRAVRAVVGRAADRESRGEVALRRQLEAGGHAPARDPVLDERHDAAIERARARQRAGVDAERRKQPIHRLVCLTHRGLGHDVLTMTNATSPILREEAPPARPTDGTVYVSGAFRPAADAAVSVFDHGLLYGDGVFEGIRAYNGRIFKLERHVERLFDSAKAIRLDI